jgi:hypothetical protein
MMDNGVARVEYEVVEEEDEKKGKVKLWTREPKRNDRQQVGISTAPAGCEGACLRQWLARAPGAFASTQDMYSLCKTCWMSTLTQIMVITIEWDSIFADITSVVRLHTSVRCVQMIEVVIRIGVVHYFMNDDDDLFPDRERIDKLNSPMPSDEHSFSAQVVIIIIVIFDSTWTPGHLGGFFALAAQ